MRGAEALALARRSRKSRALSSCWPAGRRSGRTPSCGPPACTSGPHRVVTVTFETVELEVIVPTPSGELRPAVFARPDQTAPAGCPRRARRHWTNAFQSRLGNAARSGGVFRATRPVLPGNRSRPSRHVRPRSAVGAAGQSAAPSVTSSLQSTGSTARSGGEESAWGPWVLAGCTASPRSACRVSDLAVARSGDRDEVVLNGRRSVTGRRTRSSPRSVHLRDLPGRGPKRCRRLRARVRPREIRRRPTRGHGPLGFLDYELAGWAGPGLELRS
jgi:hypothetical protein